MYFEYLTVYFRLFTELKTKRKTFAENEVNLIHKHTSLLLLIA